jgi:diacylglycerol O-acyltransferase-1
MILHQLNAHLSFAFSIMIVWNFIGVPAIGACLMLNSAIVWMKLLSYSHANQDYRLSSRKQDNDVHHQNTLALIESLDQEDMGIEYPQNVTIGNIYYFWIAPTLTYQIAFPKTPRVRITKVLGILVRMVIVFSLFTFLIAQTVAPNLENLLQDLEKTGGNITVSIMAEYWLKLSIPNTYLWLMTFYFYFHLYFNLCAELLRFGDRVFYRDWWNSCELGSYWRLWNLPVHYWLVRHLYFPCVRCGIPKGAATFFVFFFSAVMHEVLISIPFHMLRPWSFLGMMGQVPLVVVTKYLYRKNPGSSIGNMIFWTSFCLVGQPST